MGHSGIKIIKLTCLIVIGVVLAYPNVVYARRARITENKSLPEWYSNPKATYYEILEVDSKASIEQIKRAYRYLSLQWHPDRNPDIRSETGEVMKRLNEAREILCDPDKRSYYDLQAMNKDRQQAGDFVNVDDLYSQEEFRKKMEQIFKDHIMKETMEIMTLLGMTPSLIGVQEIMDIFWGRDGTIYIATKDYNSYDAGGGIVAFNPFENPTGITYDEIIKNREVNLYVYGRCYHVSQHPQDERVAAITNVLAGRKPFPGEDQQRRVIIVSNWEELLEVPDQLVRMEGWRELTQEGLISLSGDTRTLLLLDVKNPVLSWSFDGKKIIVVGENGQIIKWDVNNNTYTKSQLPLREESESYLKAIPQITISPGGIFAAVSYPRGIIVSTEEFKKTEPFVEIWDIESKQVLATLENTEACGIAWDTEGNLIFGVRPSGIHLWNWSQGYSGSQEIAGYSYFRSLQISPDGRFLGVVDTDNFYKPRVIDLHSYEEVEVNLVARYNIATGIELIQEPMDKAGGIGLLSWAPDSSHLIAEQLGRLTIWEIAPLPSFLE